MGNDIGINMGHIFCWINMDFFGKINMGTFFQVFVDWCAVSIETFFLKNDIINFESACLAKNDIFGWKWLKIDNFFEWWSPDGPQMVPDGPRWSPEVPKSDNFMRPAPKTDNFLAAG